VKEDIPPGRSDAALGQGARESGAPPSSGPLQYSAELRQFKATRQRLEVVPALSNRLDYRLAEASSSSNLSKVR